MAKFNGQLPLLLGSRIEPEFVGPLCYHNAIVLQLNGYVNGKRNAECANRLRTQKAATGIGKEREQAAVEPGRNGADAIRQTRIDGETALNLALALDAPLCFALSLGGRNTSLYSFNEGVCLMAGRLMGGEAGFAEGF
jgi:hypothetical protein